jgi:undecaprenyl-diphosphooligosaccharide--protein glycosyltransferase
LGVGLLAGSIISRFGLFGLGQIVGRWQAAHDAFIARRTWLQPLSGRVYICAACLLVIFAAALNYDVRQRQFAVWKANPHITHLDDMPLFSTADAPYFMRIAANLKRHDSAPAVSPGKISPGTALHGRASPDPQITPQITPQTGLHEIDLQARPQAADNDEEFNRWQDAPLLTAVIAVLAKDDSRAEIAKAGHLLIPVSAALTVIMVAFTFGMAGYWLEGAVAVLGGGLSFSYLSRSAAGRIDTDQLNLGFF